MWPRFSLRRCRLQQPRGRSGRKAAGAILPSLIRRGTSRMKDYERRLPAASGAVEFFLGRAHLAENNEFGKMLGGKHADHSIV
jgi:hypothetical protein